MLTTIVKSDGSTVFKLYYDRNLITIIYEPDSTCSGNPPIDMKQYRFGASVTLMDNTFVKNGYTFRCWKINPEYKPVESFVLNEEMYQRAISGNLTFTAQWTQNAPQTGDNSLIWLYAGIMIISVMSIILLIIIKRKQDKKLTIKKKSQEINKITKL